MSEKLIRTPEFKSTIKRVSTALRKWSWCMIGGRAVEVHANPPQTPDVDILVAVQPQRKNELVTLIKNQGFDLIARLDEADDKNEFPMLFFRDRNGWELDVAGAFEDIHFWAIVVAVMVHLDALLYPCQLLNELHDHEILCEITR